MKKTILLFILILLFMVNIQAAEYTADSCSAIDVQKAINKAGTGDTVILKAEQATWTTQVIITKEITLKGSGVDQTIITNAFETNYAGVLSVEIAENTNQTTRITAITFRSDQVNEDQYSIMLNGDQEYRIDHCKFADSRGFLSHDISINGYQTWGVIDHCLFDNGAVEKIVVRADNQTWTEDPTLGTRQATYLEDCTFINSPGGHAITSVRGAKTVVRYNKIHETDIDVHGHCFSDGHQSARHYEIYENDLYNLEPGYHFGMNIRGGTGVIFNNRLYEGAPGAGFFSEITLTDYRVTRDCPHDGCGQASSGGEGYPLYDQIGRGRNQGSEPLYLWNNQLDTDNDGILDQEIVANVRNVGNKDCGDLDASDFIRNVSHDGGVNPDYYEGTPMPGYIPYEYPHPLVAAGSSTPENSAEQGSGGGGCFLTNIFK